MFAYLFSLTKSKNTYQFEAHVVNLNGKNVSFFFFQIVVSNPAYLRSAITKDVTYVVSFVIDIREIRNPQPVLYTQVMHNKIKHLEFEES